MPVTALAPTGRVLVVDDDRRVRELLEAALTTHGFDVLTATDGDEAVQRAHADRPDLIVLDVRLPKRSGLDVCEALRHDPEDPALPIILVSAASDPEQRLHAFARGADDYLAKPFSPKELVARIRRHLARASDTRAALARAGELEREIASARREARRAGDDAHREHVRFEIVTGMARELNGVLDLTVLADLLLAAVRARTAHRVAALLVPDAAGRALVPWAVRGDAFRRAARVRLPLDGELVRLLAALRRPTHRVSLETDPTLRPEIESLVPGRWTWLAPLSVGGQLEALVVADDRPDGGSPSADTEAEVAVLCDAAAPAVRHARLARRPSSRLLEALAHATDGPAETARVESLALLARVAATLELPPASSEAVAHVLRLDGVPGSLEAVSALAGEDATGLAASVLDCWPRPGVPSGDVTASLIEALSIYRSVRRAGLPRPVAITAALAETADAAVIRALSLASGEPAAD